MIERLLPDGFFSSSLLGLRAELSAFGALVDAKLPRLAMHMAAHGVSPELYGAKTHGNKTKSCPPYAPYNTNRVYGWTLSCRGWPHTRPPTASHRSSTVRPQPHLTRNS